MKLYSGSTYWDKTLKLSRSFPSLDKDLKAEILIIGGGMSGNLCANVLAEQGHRVILLEKDKLAKGSSTANTGLLQYSSDIMMWELAEEIGNEKAVSFYEMCLDAMESLTALNNSLNGETDYIQRPSIYYASNREDAEKLEKEFKYLTKYDFPVEFIDEETLKKDYNIDKSCALRTWEDAQVNPYKFIETIIDKNISLGVEYFEDTEIDLNRIKDTKVYTKTGFTIEFQHIILCTGYTKIYDVIKDKASVGRTYAFSGKINKENPWKDNAMIWETKNPYIYFRTAKDNRIIAGGLDEEVDKVQEDGKIINEKAEEIKEKIEHFFPYLDIQIDYAWNALFGSSEDGMPFIGRDPENSNLYYLLGYEGNGTCYSMAGAKIIKDLIDNKDNPYADILRVDRKVI